MQRSNTWLGLVRVALLVIACSAIALLWVGHRAHAYGERMLLQLGDHMMRYAGAYHQTAPQQFTVNGASFYLSTGSVEAPLAEVLDRFHQKCRAANGQLQAQWAHAAQARHTKLDPKSTSLFDGVFRSEAPNTGVVLCAETGKEALTPQTLLVRIKAVLATGDISKLGNLRYAYVTKDHDQSVFVALWSEGPLNFRRMFPKAADAPGIDTRGVPRPPGSRRVLSTQPDGKDALVNMYSAPEGSDALMAFYWDALPKAGYTMDTQKRHFMAAHNGAHSLTISLYDDARSGHGIATVATQPD